MCYVMWSVTCTNTVGESMFASHRLKQQKQAVVLSKTWLSSWTEKMYSWSWTQITILSLFSDTLVFTKQKWTIYLLDNGLKRTATVVFSYGASRPCSGTHNKHGKLSCGNELNFSISSSKAASVRFWRSVPFRVKVSFQRFNSENLASIFTGL